MPAHRSVLQRDHPVFQSGVDQRLRADDAACPPGAVDDDKGVGVWCHLLDPVHQLRAGAVGAGRDGHVAELSDRTGVEDDHVLVGLQEFLQFRCRDSGGVVGVFYEFTKRLGRHVDTRVQLASAGGPLVDATFQDVAVCPAERRGTLCSNGRQPVGGTGLIAPHRSGVGAGHQRPKVQLEGRQRHACRVKQMRLVVDALLAGVE